MIHRQLTIRPLLWIALLLGALCLCILIVVQTSLSYQAPVHPEATRVLVIANRNSPVSLRVAQYYMQRRRIPSDHFLSLDLPDSTFLPFVSEAISFPTYQKHVEQPVRLFLEQHQLTHHIRYIVLTRGIPIRVLDVHHKRPNGEMFIQNQSLDSTLATLDYKLNAVEFRDPWLKEQTGDDLFGLLTPNLYWRQTYPFEHQLTGGYLVTRLDGYREADARALVDRALIARDTLTGSVLLDNSDEAKGTVPPLIDIFDPATCTPEIIPHCTLQSKALIEASAQDTDNDLRLSAQNIQADLPTLHVQIAPPQTFATGQNLLCYMSWGSNDKFFKLENYHNLEFLPGAIADTVVSSSGRTLFPTRRGQSLIGDLIALKKGVTGVRGYIEEPELQGIGSPSVLFERYFKGANLAIAYYQSIRFIGWRDLVLGDPLATAVFREQF